MHETAVHYVFTKAEPQDIPCLQAIEERIYQDTYTQIFGPKFVAYHIASGQIRKELDEYLEQCIIMYQDTVLIGFAITIDNTIRDIYIDIPYQHKGHGTVFLQHIEDLLFAQYETIELGTYNTNTNAMNFYARHGWIQIPWGLKGTSIAKLQKHRSKE
ncbi:GNAT family N-acetyltransferase [Breznakiellaceae bacterium SP9]